MENNIILIDYNIVGKFCFKILYTNFLYLSFLQNIFVIDKMSIEK